jgi:hypothetical protein
LKHNLITAHDVIGVIADNKPVEHKYFLSSMLVRLQDPTAPDELLQSLDAQAQRFRGDYSWMTAITEAILQLDPTRLHDLVLFGLPPSGEVAPTGSVLDWLHLGARRANVRIEPRTLELFDRQPPEVKRRLLPLMVLDRRQEILEHAFQFLGTYQEPYDERRRAAIAPTATLYLRDQGDSAAFLAAVPAVTAADMLTVLAAA